MNNVADLRSRDEGTIKCSMGGRVGRQSVDSAGLSTEAERAIASALGEGLSRVPENTRLKLSEIYDFLDADGKRKLLTFLRSPGTLDESFQKMIDDISAIVKMKEFAGQMKIFEDLATKQRLVGSIFDSMNDINQGRLGTCTGASSLNSLLMGSNRNVFTKFLRGVIDDGLNEDLGIELPKNTIAAFSASRFGSLGSYLFQVGFMTAGSGSYNPATDTSYRPWAAQISSKSLNETGLWSDEMYRAMRVFFGPVEEIESFKTAADRNKAGEQISKALRDGSVVVLGSYGLALEGYRAEAHAVSIVKREVVDGVPYLFFKDTRGAGLRIDPKLFPQIESLSGETNVYRVPEEYLLKNHVEFIGIAKVEPDHHNSEAAGSYSISPDSLIEVNNFRNKVREYESDRPLPTQVFRLTIDCESDIPLKKSHSNKPAESPGRDDGYFAAVERDQELRVHRTKLRPASGQVDTTKA